MVCLCYLAEWEKAFRKTVERLVTPQQGRFTISKREKKKIKDRLKTAIIVLLWISRYYNSANTVLHCWTASIPYMLLL